MAAEIGGRGAGETDKFAVEQLVWLSIALLIAALEQAGLGRSAINRFYANRS
ncbi:MAG: hypothetical protein ACI9ZF_000713, partial [Bradyrhizobium sp.]